MRSCTSPSRYTQKRKEAKRTEANRSKAKQMPTRPRPRQRPTKKGAWDQADTGQYVLWSAQKVKTKVRSRERHEKEKGGKEQQDTHKDGYRDPPTHQHEVRPLRMRRHREAVRATLAQKRLVGLRVAALARERFLAKKRETEITNERTNSKRTRETSHNSNMKPNH